MSTTAWTRARSTANAWTAAQSTALIVKLNSGQTILRNHLAWGFGGYTSAFTGPTSMQGNLMTMGLVTTIGNGTETVPNPITASGNASDPSQRWLYWSNRAPVCVVWDSASPAAVWQSSPNEEPSSSEGQVLAPSGMGTGNTLNLWFTWQPVGAWDATGQAIVWWSVSCLVRSP